MLTSTAQKKPAPKHEKQIKSLALINPLIFLHNYQQYFLSLDRSRRIVHDIVKLDIKRGKKKNSAHEDIYNCNYYYRQNGEIFSCHSFFYFILFFSFPNYVIDGFSFFYYDYWFDYPSWLAGLQIIIFLTCLFLRDFSRGILGKSASWGI